MPQFKKDTRNLGLCVPANERTTPSPPPMEHGGLNANFYAIGKTRQMFLSNSKKGMCDYINTLINSYWKCHFSCLLFYEFT